MQYIGIMLHVSHLLIMGILFKESPIIMRSRTYDYIKFLLLLLFY